MATVPNPQDWSPNTVPTATQFNTEIKDAVNFLTAPKRALVYHTGTNQDLANQTWTRMEWNQEHFDTDTIHDNSTNNHRLTAKTAGRYQVYLSCRWEWHTFTGGARAIMVCKNSNGSVGTNVIASDRRRADEFITTTHGNGPQCCTGFVSLAVNDYVEAFAWQDQKTPQTVIPGGTGTPVNSEIYSIIPSNNANTVLFGMIWVGSV